LNLSFTPAQAIAKDEPKEKSQKEKEHDPAAGGKQDKAGKGQGDDNNN
jgi:hypothetical protein